MVIWLYCIFSNEAAILPFFLRHYASLDRLEMIDNGSTDNSRELIRAYPNADILDYPSPRAVMDSAQMAQYAGEKYKEARGLADYVIWVDCDEFLWNGPISLREAIRGYRQHGLRAVKSCGYQMLADGFPENGAAITDRVRYGVRDTEYDKVAIFDPMLDIRWRPGRHNCRIDGVEAHQADIRLLHYRYLGAEYFTQRNAYNHANISATERAANRSYHVAPDYTSGKYSAVWFEHIKTYATDVVTQNWIGV